MAPTKSRRNVTGRSAARRNRMLTIDAPRSSRVVASETAVPKGFRGKASYKKGKAPKKRRSRGKYLKKRGGGGRGRGRGGPSLGKKAFNGSRDPNSAGVNKHAVSGVVYEYHTSGLLGGGATNLHSGCIVQSTNATFNVIIGMFLALVKLAYNNNGTAVKNIDTALPIMNGYNSTLVAYIVYYYSGATGLVKQNFSYSGTLGTDTLYTVAQNLASQYIALTAASSQDVIKFVSFTVNTSISSVTLPFVTIDLDSVTFNFDICSKLVFQNRSVADSVNTSALDIDQMPLFHSSVVGGGNGPMQKFDFTTPVMDLIVDQTSGVFAQDFLTNKTLGSEPVKSSWSNLRGGFVRDVLNPGVITDSSLKYHRKITWNHLHTMFKDFGSGNPNFNPSRFGNFKFHWFAKSMDLLSSTTGYSVAYNHEWSLGCTALYRRKTVTAPYIQNFS